MRVELLYTAQCSSYRKALRILERVIAEEQLPCPVELMEVEHLASPMIKVDGEALSEPISKSEGLPCMEALRSLLSRRWYQLTGMIPVRI